MLPTDLAANVENNRVDLTIDELPIELLFSISASIQRWHYLQRLSNLEQLFLTARWCFRIN